MVHVHRAARADIDDVLRRLQRDGFRITSVVLDGDEYEIRCELAEIVETR